MCASSEFSNLTSGSKSLDCGVSRLDLFKKVYTIRRIPAYFEVEGRGYPVRSAVQRNTRSLWEMSCGHNEQAVSYSL